MDEVKLPPWLYGYDQVAAKFDPRKTPRNGQKEFIRRGVEAFKAGKKFLVGALPTGVGKSDVAKAFGDVVADDCGAYMITPQKALQDQYERDFPAPQMELLKGRSNYACTHPMATPGMDAGHAVCHAQKKGILRDCVKSSGWDEETGGSILAAAAKLSLPPEAHLCPYWKQLQKCNDSAFTLFNFSSFLFQRRIGRFQKRSILIVDEGHRIEEEILKYVTLELTDWALSILNLKIDRQLASSDQLVDWLREMEVVSKIERALGVLDEDGDSTDEELREVEKDALKELNDKIALFLKYLEREEWIIETVQYESRGEPRTKIVGRPLYAKNFAKDLLFAHADRVIVLSATILNVELWAANLGIPTTDLEYVEVPLDFPASDRPIHLEFCGNMSKKYLTAKENPKDPTAPKFIRKVEQILERHNGQRGIIHSHSNDISRLLRDSVRSPRFLFQDDFRGDKKEMLVAHGKRTDSVIVAPAMHEGFDFKGDLARFQIIAKIPWPSLGDKLIKERAFRDDAYYGWLTALKMVQSYGRICRFNGDWGYTYIVDSGFQFYFSKHGHMLPTWFKEALNRYAPKVIRHDDVGVTV